MKKTANINKNRTTRLYKSAMACFKSLRPVDQKSSLVSHLRDGVMKMKKALQFEQKGLYAYGYFNHAKTQLQVYIDSAANVYTYSKICKSKARRR